MICDLCFGGGGLEMDDDDLDWDHVSRGRYMLLSMVLGTSLDFLSFPADLLKTRLQVQGWSYSSVSVPHYSGLGAAFRSVLEHEGVKGFWKVNSLIRLQSLLSHVLHRTIFFFSFFFFFFFFLTDVCVSLFGQTRACFTLLCLVVFID